MPTSLAVDFGSKYIGIALVRHAKEEPNRVLYAATVVVDPIWLTKTVKPRIEARRIRRPRKTHRRRLRRLARALDGIHGADRIVRFCRRRGFSYDVSKDTDKESRSFHDSRSVVVVATKEPGCHAANGSEPRAGAAVNVNALSRLLPPEDCGLLVL